MWYNWCNAYVFNILRGDCSLVKLKIIKKILSAILVASTVISTPGLVSAGPKGRKQGEDAKKTETFLGKKTAHGQGEEENGEGEQAQGQNHQGIQTQELFSLHL